MDEDQGSWRPRIADETVVFGEQQKKVLRGFPGPGCGGWDSILQTANAEAAAGRRKSRREHQQQKGVCGLCEPCGFCAYLRSPLGQPTHPPGAKSFDPHHSKASSNSLRPRRLTSMPFPEFCDDPKKRKSQSSKSSQNQLPSHLPREPDVASHCLVLPPVDRSSTTRPSLNRMIRPARAASVAS
jgi:hypothetical protein